MWVASSMVSLSGTYGSPVDMNPTLQPQSRHDYTVWRSMDRAPKEGYPIQHVDLLMEDGSIEKNAHWAQDLSGEDQPPFRGWFVPVERDDGSVNFNRQVAGEIKAWAEIRSEPNSLSENTSTD